MGSRNPGAPESKSSGNQASTDSLGALPSALCARLGLPGAGGASVCHPAKLMGTPAEAGGKRAPAVGEGRVLRADPETLRTRGWRWGGQSWLQCVDLVELPGEADLRLHPKGLERFKQDPTSLWPVQFVRSGPSSLARSLRRVLTPMSAEGSPPTPPPQDAGGSARGPSIPSPRASAGPALTAPGSPHLLAGCTPTPWCPFAAAGLPTSNPGL